MMTKTGKMLAAIWLSLAVAVTLMLVLGAQTAYAESELPASGTCGTNVSWAIDANGNMTISGSGAMDDFYVEGSPWYSYGKQIKSVSIGNDITRVGDCAFYGRSYEYVNIKTVTLPDSLKTIGYRAFWSCSGIENIILPSTSVTLEEGAFGYCSGMQSVTIPDTGIVLGEDAFGYCTSLENLVIPGTTKVGKKAFEQCSGIKTLQVRDGVTVLGTGAFSGCTSLESAVLPDSMTDMGASTFSSAKFTSFHIPTGLTELKSDVFSDSQLTSITIPDGIKVIGESAFLRCNGLTSIVIPEGVTTIGRNAFYACRYLENIEIPSTVTSVGDDAFSSTPWQNNQTGPIIINSVYYLYQGQDTSLTIPEGIKTICPYAFESCTTLEEITIPEGVTTIGRNAFYYTTALQKITIPQSVKEIGVYAFYGHSQDLVIYGYNGTYAESYANENSIPFESLGDEPCPAGGTHEWTLVNHKASFTQDGYQSMECSKCGADNGIAIGALHITTAKLAKTSYVYTGKAIKPAVTLANADGTLSQEYYKLTYSNNTKVGKASVTITLQGDYFEGIKKLTFIITQAANPLSVKGRTASVKYSALKKKNATLKTAAVIRFVKKGQGTLTYTKASGSSKITIAKKTGKVTVKKGLKKGTYKVKVKIKAAGNTNYKASAVKTVTFKVKVK